MGRIIVEQIVSADGFAQDSDGGMSFVSPADANDSVDRDQLAMLAHVDVIVMGRRTYEMFAEYWPTAPVEQNPAAVPMNALPKHVISSTLDRAPWGEGELAIERGDAVESVRRLQNAHTGDVIVWGSLTLTDALFGADLVTCCGCGSCRRSSGPDAAPRRPRSR